MTVGTSAWASAWRSASGSEISLRLRVTVTVPPASVSTEKAARCTCTAPTATVLGASERLRAMVAPTAMARATTTPRTGTSGLVRRTGFEFARAVATRNPAIWLLKTGVSGGSGRVSRLDMGYLWVRDDGWAVRHLGEQSAQAGSGPRQTEAGR